MSEERFQRIETKLDEVAADVSVLKADVSVLKADVSVLKADVSVLKADVSVLKADVSVLKADVGGLKTDVGGLHAKYDSLSTRVDDLRREMHVLHEDTIDRIRAMNGTEILRAEMRAGFAEVLQRLADHAIPGEAADRQFGRVLDDHEQRIQALERRGT